MIQTDRLSSNDKLPQRIVYFDVLNIIATISVVWIHFGNEVHWYDGSQAWYWCLLIQVLCFWAVPVFLMLTGATLMEYNKKYSTATFFKRRVLRTLIPYLFWGSIMIFIQISRGNMDLSYGGNALQFQFSIIDIFLHNKMEHIYWFFPVVFGIYLCMPVLTVLTEERHRKKLDYLVIVGVLTVSIFPFFFRMLQEYLGFPISGWNSGLQLPVLGGYLLYPVLGYWASRRDFSKTERILLYITAISCAVLRYNGLRMLSERDGYTNTLYMDYMGFPAMFLALGVFVFVRYACQRYQNLLCRAAKALSVVSSCSLGIYLIHNLVLNEMSQHAFFAKYSFQWYFIWPWVCYLFCLAVVYICKKFPLIKKVFP